MIKFLAIHPSNIINFGLVVLTQHLGQVYPVLTFGVFDLLLGEAQSLLVTVRTFLFLEKSLDVAHKSDNRQTLLMESVCATGVGG